ncbi:MAG: hypothetical protein JNL43_10385 [Flavobacteriales bacterium]|nr:hypothetical protein [Flavobacteriales bacterium]
MRSPQLQGDTAGTGVRKGARGVLRTLITGLRFLAIAMLLYGSVFFALCHVHFQQEPLAFRSAPYYHYKGGISWRKFREFDPRQHWDVIVVGSSHAYRGYDPRVFAEQGIRSFNLGSSAQSTTNTAILLENYVTKANCGLLILDVYDKALGTSGLESTSDLTQNIPSARAAARMAFAQCDPRALNMMALRWLTADVRHYDDTSYVNGGFAQRTDTAQHGMNTTSDMPVVLDPLQVENLHRCIAFAREHDIPLVLVTHCAPGPVKRARHAAFRTFIKSCLLGTGIHYIDLTYGHQLDAHEHFYDDNHLNLAGVRLFNAQLLDSLRAYDLIGQ